MNKGVIKKMMIPTETADLSWWDLTDTGLIEGDPALNQTRPTECWGQLRVLGSLWIQWQWDQDLSLMLASSNTYSLEDTLVSLDIGGRSLVLHQSELSDFVDSPYEILPSLMNGWGFRVEKVYRWRRGGSRNGISI